MSDCPITDTEPFGDPGEQVTCCPFCGGDVEKASNAAGHMQCVTSEKRFWIEL